MRLPTASGWGIQKLVIEMIFRVLMGTDFGLKFSMISDVRQRG